MAAPPVPIKPLTRPLIIVCDWIPPAYGAVGQYEFARAHEAAQAGRPTTLIGLGSDTHRSEEIAASGTAGAPLRIVRLTAKPAGKTNLVLRALWALQMNMRLIGETLRALRPGDQAELKITGSPPFLAYLVIALNAVLLRRSLTYRMTDFYPETALAAGKAGFLKPIVPLFHWLRRFADRLEVLSECQERRLIESGVAKDRITILRDGSPVTFSTAVSAQRPFPADTVTLLYSGNLGVAHEIDTLAEAYRRHVQSGPNRVRLWLNATGAKVKALEVFCRLHDLPLHKTAPVPLDQLAGVLMAADAHLVTLDKPFWGYVIPSKIYACIKSGRPILYVGPQESDIHSLVTAVSRSASVRNGDVDACLAALNRLGEYAGSASALAEPALEAPAGQASL